MDITRFLLKQETKDKLQEETRNSAGELRWNKLKELEQDGSLATAKTRRDVVRLLGYDKDNTLAYNWVSSQVRKGYIVEQLTDTPGEYQYYTSGSEPHYDLKEQARKMRERKKEKKKQPRKQMRLSTSYRDTRLARFNAIKQLQDSGEIAKITTRRELCKAIKVSPDRARGWISAMVSKGYIDEANPWETPRYSLTQKALKEMSTPIKTIEAKPAAKTVVLKPIAQPATTTDTTVATKQSDLTMAVHYGDLTIEFKGITQETINSLIDKLTSKAK